MKTCLVGIIGSILSELLSCSCDDLPSFILDSIPGELVCCTCGDVFFLSIIKINLLTLFAALRVMMLQFWWHVCFSFDCWLFGVSFLVLWLWWLVFSVGKVRPPIVFICPGAQGFALPVLHAPPVSHWCSLLCLSVCLSVCVSQQQILNLDWPCFVLHIPVSHWQTVCSAAIWDCLPYDYVLTARNSYKFGNIGDYI